MAQVADLAVVGELLAVSVQTRSSRLDTCNLILLTWHRLPQTDTQKP